MAARLRNTSTKAPVTLPKDAYLVLTTSGAANAKAARVDVVGRPSPPAPCKERPQDAGLPLGSARIRPSEHSPAS